MAKSADNNPPDLFSTGSPAEPEAPTLDARQQLDLFVAFIGDVPLRDDREGMSVPLVSGSYWDLG